MISPTSGSDTSSSSKELVQSLEEKSSVKRISILDVSISFHKTIGLALDEITRKLIEASRIGYSQRLNLFASQLDISKTFK